MSFTLFSPLGKLACVNFVIFSDRWENNYLRIGSVVFELKWGRKSKLCRNSAEINLAFVFPLLNDHCHDNRDILAELATLFYRRSFIGPAMPNRLDDRNDDGRVQQR